jgi:hypothetical protein
MATMQITETYMENGREITAAKIYHEGEYGIVIDFPECDLCGAEAHYDAQDRTGVWGNLCLTCWFVNTDRKLGWGIGQRLIQAN